VTVLGARRSGRTSDSGAYAPPSAGARPVHDHDPDRPGATRTSWIAARSRRPRPARTLRPWTGWSSPGADPVHLSVATQARFDVASPGLAGGDDLDALFRRWHDSDRRSRARRSVVSRPRRVRPLVVSMALGVGVLGLTSPELGDDVTPRPGRALAVAGPGGGQAYVKGVAASSAPAVPSVSAMRKAWRFARRRGGQVSLAVVDTEGRLRGRDGGRRYVSASVVKAMLLLAEFRRLRRSRLPLDSATQDTLAAMITRSDNDAADSIYGRVGDSGLLAVARSAHLRRFTVSGYWANAQVTAADLARLFSRLRQLLPRRHRRTGLGLLASVVREQRWGLPRAASGSWRVYFKGGWRATGRGELVHQAALLNDGDRDLAIAVLTDAQPSRIYGIHTVRGVANRLLTPPAAAPSGRALRPAGRKGLR
jgi:beta-lactamase class A